MNMAWYRPVVAGTGTTRVMYNLRRTALAPASGRTPPKGETREETLMATAKKKPAAKKAAKKPAAKKAAKKR